MAHRGLAKQQYAALLHRGARVAILDVNEERGNAIADELGANALFAKVDVTDEASVQNAIEQILQRFGSLHVCCNFAGVANAIKTLGKNGPFPLENFRKVIDINLLGTFNVLRLAAQAMSRNEADEDRGVIINTASIAAYEGQMGQAAYSASKGGVVAMTLPLARDLASYRIRVNTIVPGLIHTPMANSLPPEALKSLSESPLYPQRLGNADEVAHVAQFLVENDYMNGECIRIDAGIRMQPK